MRVYEISKGIASYLHEYYEKLYMYRVSTTSFSFLLVGEWNLPFVLSFLRRVSLEADGFLERLAALSFDVYTLKADGFLERLAIYIYIYIYDFS